jgi:hypothetical protein
MIINIIIKININIIIITNIMIKIAVNFIIKIVKGTMKEITEKKEMKKDYENPSYIFDNFVIFIISTTN